MYQKTSQATIPDSLGQQTENGTTKKGKQNYVIATVCDNIV